MNAKDSITDTAKLIQAARGLRKCDLVLRGGYVINVFTGEIARGDVGIVGSRIAVVSAGNGGIEAEDVLDAENLFLSPGLIDAHMHLESTMLTPAEFAWAVLPLGTTSVVIDPHEIANVAGAEGIRELMTAADGLPLTFYFMIPPAVPACNLDTSGERLTTREIRHFAAESNVLGIAEAMDCLGVLECRQEALEKLAAMPGKVIDGHAPGMDGRDLQAYATAGIGSDHESTNSWEAMEKLRAGMYLMIREGSAARNLDDLIGLVDINTISRCLLVTDDLLPSDLVERGHINYLLSRAVRHGISPVQAIKMATVNAAQRFKIDRVGAIAPGYVADIAAFEDLADFHAAFVIAKGQLAAMDGEVMAPIPTYDFDHDIGGSVHLPALSRVDIEIPAGGGPASVIEAVDGQVVTRRIEVAPGMLGGHVVSDSDRDILKIVVVERHGRSGRVGVGLISGFGLKAGALASSVAHDSHNVVAVGAGDSDILTAILRIGQLQGGLVVAAGGRVTAELPLPIAGLMSRAGARETADRLINLERAARELGCEMRRPFMTLSFMTLPVIPEIKITEAGLIDVKQCEFIPLFNEERGAIERAASG